MEALGFYGLSDQAKTYHPLEAVLVGEDAHDGGWKSDAAAKLCVTNIWIDGFIDGFAQAGEHSADQDYIQGYLTAEELRARKFRWLPN